MNGRQQPRSSRPGVEPRDESMEDAREFSACSVSLAAVVSASLFRFEPVMYEGELEA